MCSHETCCQEDDGIHQAHDPFIFSLTSNAEFLRERQVGTVGSCLIPALCRSSDGTQTDGIPEHEWTVPFVISLVGKRSALLFIKLHNPIESVGVACHEGSSTEQSGMLGQVMRLGERVGIGYSLLPGATLRKGEEDQYLLICTLTVGKMLSDQTSRQLTLRGFSTMLRAATE